MASGVKDVSEPGVLPVGSEMRGRFGRSVQTKVLFYVVPLVLISTVIVFGLFEWNARRTAEQQLQVKLQRLVDIQSAVVAESLWNVADQQIKLILSALLTDSDVLAAAVYDDRDRLISEVGTVDAIDTARFTAQEDIYYDTGDADVRIGSLNTATQHADFGIRFHGGGHFGQTTRQQTDIAVDQYMVAAAALLE